MSSEAPGKLWMKFEAWARNLGGPEDSGYAERASGCASPTTIIRLICVIGVIGVIGVW